MLSPSPYPFLQGKGRFKVKALPPWEEMIRMVFVPIPLPLPPGKGRCWLRGFPPPGAGEVRRGGDMDSMLSPSPCPFL